MSKTEDERIDSIFGALSPADKAQARRLMRRSRLSVALLSKEEPKETFVLVTVDGRTLEMLPDNTFGLDAGDKPKHWSEERADELSIRWNRDRSEKDHVKRVYWREHYQAQVDRLDARDGK